MSVYVPSGSTSVVGTNGATFYITGVQLEKGSTATSFDYRPYGTELALCQRYYWKLAGGANYSAVASGFAGNTTDAYVFSPSKVSMRATPSIGYANLQLANPSVGVYTVSSIVFQEGSSDIFQLKVVSSGLTSNGGITLRNANNSSGYLEYSSEL